VVAWSAVVASAGVGGAGHQYAYRAIRVSLDPSQHGAEGICTKTTTEAEVGWDGSFGLSGQWERGQHIGLETLRVVAWLGPHHTSGGADETGYAAAVVLARR
jgi:hypothetical protein